MDEIALVTCSSDASIMSATDLRSGTPFCSFKTCVSDSGAVCLIGGASSYSGLGSCDYIAVAQFKKPVIHMYSWGRQQPVMQFHLQEISTSLASDPQSTLLVAGSRTGRITIWDVQSGMLLVSWGAHFQSISRLVISACGSFLVSAADDGTVKVWDVCLIINSSGKEGSSFSSAYMTGKSILPFRSHSLHTLPVKDLVIYGSAREGSLRVITSSMDRSVVAYDVFSATETVKLVFPSAISAVVCSVGEDVLFAGSSDGKIFIVDLNERAVAVSAAHAEIACFGISTYQSSASRNEGFMTIDAHNGPITSLAVSTDCVTLISTATDGTFKLWDTLTRQCLRESKPIGKAVLTNVMVLPKPEIMLNSTNKPTLTQITHIKKYADSNAPATIGPLLRGCFATLEESLQTYGNCMSSSYTEHPSKRARRSGAPISSAFDLQAEYIKLPDASRTVDTEETEDTEGRSNNDIFDNKKTILELQNAVAQLKEENSRWRNVCKQIKAGIE